MAADVDPTAISKVLREVLVDRGYDSFPAEPGLFDDMLADATDKMVRVMSGGVSTVELSVRAKIREVGDTFEINEDYIGDFQGYVEALSRAITEYFISYMITARERWSREG